MRRGGLGSVHVVLKMKRWARSKLARPHRCPGEFWSPSVNVLPADAVDGMIRRCTQRLIQGTEALQMCSSITHVAHLQQPILMQFSLEVERELLDHSWLKIGG